MSNIAEQAWNKVRNKEAGDPEYQFVSPEFKATLAHAVGEIQSKGISTGIAGLEEFEKEVGRLAGKTVSESGVDAGRIEGSNQATVTSAAPVEVQQGGTEGSAKRTPKGTGAQKGTKKVASKAKALADATGAGQKVESDEVNSPGYPSAARPLGSESAANQPVVPAEKAAAKKSGAKKSGSKAAKKR